MLDRSYRRIDFDGKPEDLVRQAFRASYDHNKPRIRQWRRDYEIMEGFMSMALRDSDMFHVALPKIRQIVMSKWPRVVKATSGMRPYFPFTTKRPEFRSAVQMWVDFCDELVHEAHFWKHSAFAALLKTVYGFAGADVTPYFEEVAEKGVVLTPMGPRFQDQTVQRLRLRFRTYAAWEVFPDPHARGCEERGECRYLVKLDVSSKREVMKLAARGGYPGLDIEQLNWTSGAKGMPNRDELEGQKMLRGIGLNPPEPDDDVCIIKRYESEDRFVDVMNDTVVLRDIPNPFRDKRINFSRWLHTFTPHTEAAFFAPGEVKPNEILQDILNEMFGMMLSTHGQIDQPTIYHDSKIPGALIVKRMGGRVPVPLGPTEDIRQKILEDSGRGLPPDHYRVQDRIDAWMDRNANNYPTARGEGDEADRTASEAFLLNENASSTQELEIRMGEELFLHSLGKRVLTVVTQGATMEDLFEVCGRPRVMQAMVQAIQAGVAPGRVNPIDLPGGTNFDFKGSDRVANVLLKQRNFKVLFDMLTKTGNVSPQWLAMEALRTWEMDTPEAEQAVIPDQVMEMMRMLKEEAEAERQVAVKQAQPGPGALPRSGREGALQQMREVRQAG